jgi:putative ABC transport system substrate-binding protein
LWHAANLEGRNVVFEHTYVDENYELFPARTRVLLDRKVDLIVASVAAAAVAAAKITKDVPIVFTTSSGDPAKIGLVESIRRPGGNLTGLTLFAPEMTLKHLQLLREIVPGLTRVAILWNPANVDHPAVLKSAEEAAASLNLKIVSVGTKSPQELPAAFAAIEKADVGGLIMLVDSMLRVNRKSIVDLVSDHRLPAIYPTRDYVESGGLMGYGACVRCNFKHSARYISDIFKGAKPADMPVEQPEEFDTLVNLKTAKALNITIPPSIHLRADDVIE